MVHRLKCERNQTSRSQRDVFVGKDFLKQSQKPLTLKERIDKISFDKLQTSVYKKPIVKRVKP